MANLITCISLLVLIALIGMSENHVTHYCTSRRPRQRYYDVRDYYKCRWWLRRTCVRHRRVYYTQYYDVRVCCSGWKGSYCHTPICKPECSPTNGSCVAPNTCT